MNCIDMSIIRGKKSRFITSEEVLKGVKSTDWRKEVSDGRVCVFRTQ